MSIEAQSQANTKKIRPSSTKPKAAPPVEEIRVGANLAGLGADLRAITSASENREQLVDHFTELAVQRSAFLCCGWVQARAGEDVQLLSAKFSNPALNNDNVKTQIVNAAQLAIVSQRAMVIPSDKVRGAAIISVPFFIDEKTAGVITGVVHSNDENCAESLLVAQMVATHFDTWRSKDQLTDLAFEVRSTATVLELVGKTQATKTVKEACYVIANELKDLLRCEYVAVGLRQGEKRGCNLIALSGMAEFDRESRTTLLLRSTFDEAVTRGRYTVYPTRVTGDRSATLCHKKLAGHMRTESAITIPLRTEDDEIVGAVTVMGNRFIDRNDSTRNLISALEHPLGNSVQVIKYAEGGWLKKASRFLAARDKKHTTRIAAGLAGLILLAMFIPLPYRVYAKCTAEPVVRRTSVAPYDGLLENTFVEPGDLVTKGQLLAKMDGREIGFKKAGLVADRVRAAKKSDSHRAIGQIPDSLMAKLEYRQLAAETELLEHHQKNLELISPIDGIILSGSIDRRENYPVTIGQSLYEIAPIHQLRVEIAIPADEVMHIQPEQKVKFRFDGFGTQSQTGTIKRIRPSTTIRNDKNVFIAEALVENPDGLIRPGMNGNARVYGQRKTIGWSLFHRPWERMITAIGF